MILSECTYKSKDIGVRAATEQAVARLAAALPAEAAVSFFSFVFSFFFSLFVFVFVFVFSGFFFVLLLFRKEREGKTHSFLYPFFNTKHEISLLRL